MKSLWKIWGLVERQLAPSNRRPYVVLGFPRSGTSTISRLVQQCGVNFGPGHLFRSPDWRNQAGFMEMVEMNKIDISLMKQSASNTPLYFDTSSGLRAVGLRRRMARLITLFRMQRLLKQISGGNDRWGFKSFPASFYFWKRYVPEAKIVAVYRDPRTTAFSIQRSFKRYSYDQLLTFWKHAHYDLLYHLAKHDHLLIRLEDLSDKQKQRKIISELTMFVGGGDEVELASTVGNAKQQRKPNLIADTPIDGETQELIDTLDMLRVK